MSDVNDIITLVLDDEKLKNSSSFGGKVYGDEPILRPASALARPAVRQEQRKNNIPERIMEMRGLPYRSDIRWQSRECIFYEQAKFMEDYEDDCPYNGDFTMYYPTYGSMTADQLRGYFTWRTAVRRGDFRNAPASFIFVYIYELLNGIGTDTPEDGYDRLKQIAERYGGETVIRTYLNRWIKDYVIYNKLPASLIGDSEDVSFDKAAMVLTGWDKYGDDELFEALVRMSAYNIEKSKFYGTFPEDYKTIACAVYRKLAEHYDSHNKKPLSEKYFGCRVRTPYYMFRSAVFYEHSGRRSFVYEVNEFQSYECVNGLWYSDMIQGCCKSSKELGELMRAVDHLMRERYDFKHKLGGCRATKLETGIIEKEIDGIFERKKREEAARIEIDVSKLNGIRQAADITRDKLIVDEETYDAEEPEIITEECETAPEVPDDIPLDAGEYRFMRCLLYGGDINAAAAEAGRLPSIIADSVNEKFFDLFGDTVIDFSGGDFTLIEDYTDELKGMIKE